MTDYMNLNRERFSNPDTHRTTMLKVKASAGHRGNTFNHDSQEAEAGTGRAL